MERREEESAKGAWKEMPSTSEVLDRNTAIQNLFDTVFGGSGSKLAGQFVYATLITFVVIFAAIAVIRAAERAKKAEEEQRNLRLLQGVRATTALA